jgi:hypothetical protein
MTAAAANPGARLRLLSRPGCHLCEEMRREVDEILRDSPHAWEIVDVDSDPALAAEFGEAIPILYVNERLFARTRMPPIAAALRLKRAAGRR